MRRLLQVGLVLALAAGCEKPADQDATTRSAPQTGLTRRNPAAAQPGAAPGNQPAVHAPSGVVLNPGVGSGGGGGAAQAVRQAVTRVVNEHELNNVRLFIDTASLSAGRMPTAQEVAAALQREAPKTYKLVQDGAIVLTGTRSRENIWAYTADPQTSSGDHLVVTASGVERMNAQLLRQRLEGQHGQ